jgi:hypothetical protein
MYAQHTSRTARIASIIEKRRPLAEKIAGVEANLRSLASALRNLEDSSNFLVMQVNDRISLRWFFTGESTQLSYSWQP